MTLAAALWASSSALTGKVALASLTSVSLFGLFDRRRITFAWCILLGVLATACSSVAAAHSPSNSAVNWLWASTAAIAAGATVRALVQWSKTEPVAVYEETSAIDTGRKRKEKETEHQYLGTVPRDTVPRDTKDSDLGFWIGALPSSPQARLAARFAQRSQQNYG